MKHHVTQANREQVIIRPRYKKVGMETSCEVVYERDPPGNGRDVKDPLIGSDDAK